MALEHTCYLFARLNIFFIKTNGNTVQLFLCKNIRYSYELEDVRSEDFGLGYNYTTTGNEFSSTIDRLAKSSSTAVGSIGWGLG